MRIRVTAGVGAWIVGATTATGLSLVAVSHLSPDPQSPQGAALSQTQVNQALASVTGTAASSTPPAAVTTQPASVTPVSPTPTSSATTAPAAPVRSPHTEQPIERTLSGDGGTVVAQCQDSMVYLVTWTPAQGYQAEAPQRGPARTATVVFTGYGNHIEFHVGCPAGIPAPVEGDDGHIDH